MRFQYDDGGRAAAGFRGDAGDCVTRAIAIATRQGYLTVYNSLNALAKSEPGGHMPPSWLRPTVISAVMLDLSAS